MQRTLISFAAILCAAGVSFFVVESAHAQNRTMFGNSSRSGISNGSSTTGGLGSTMFGNSGGLGSGGSGTTGGLSGGTQSPYGNNNSGFIGRNDQFMNQFIGRGDPNATGTTGTTGRNGTMRNQGGNQNARNFAQRNQGRGNNGRNGNSFNNGNFNGNNGAAATQRTIQYQPRQQVDFTYRSPAPAAVQGAVNERLSGMALNAAALRNIDVSIDDNRLVTLRGEVADDRAKRMAEIVARMEPGVRDVKNELTVRSSVQ
jgi:osmotically-inducible protein OsmY